MFITSMVSSSWPALWETVEAVAAAAVVFLSVLGCASVLRWRSRWMPKKWGARAETNPKEVKRVYDYELTPAKVIQDCPSPPPPPSPVSLPPPPLNKHTLYVTEKPEAIYENVQYAQPASENHTATAIGEHHSVSCEPDAEETSVYLNQSFNVYSNYDSSRRYEEDYIFPDEECEDCM